MNNLFLQICCSAAAVCALAAISETALAQQKIGSTAAVVNDVSRELAGATGPLKSGDSVFRNEIVRAAAASKAKLVFLDSTNLIVGPASEVTLDEFVYSGPSEPAKAQKMEVSLTSGVFRFTTGTLDKKAYLITTPVASIGVQGTVLDIDVGARSLASLWCKVGRSSARAGWASRSNSNGGIAKNPRTAGGLCASASSSIIRVRRPRSDRPTARFTRAVLPLRSISLQFARGFPRRFARLSGILRPLGPTVFREALYAGIESVQEDGTWASDR